MKDQIKSYLQRLNHGEALENVQADFVRECKDVDPAEIMHAEQELLGGYFHRRIAAAL
jgi:DUF438 domain-containing protein